MSVENCRTAKWSGPVRTVITLGATTDLTAALNTRETIRGGCWRRCGACDSQFKRRGCANVASSDCQFCFALPPFAVGEKNGPLKYVISARRLQCHAQLFKGNSGVQLRSGFP